MHGGGAHDRRTTAVGSVIGGRCPRMHGGRRRDAAGRNGRAIRRDPATGAGDPRPGSESVAMHGEGKSHGPECWGFRGPSVPDCPRTLHASCQSHRPRIFVQWLVSVHGANRGYPTRLPESREFFPTFRTSGSPPREGGFRPGPRRNSSTPEGRCRKVNRGLVGDRGCRRGRPATLEAGNRGSGHANPCR